MRRLEDLRAQAEEERARALVALGRPLEAVPELRRLIAADPLREELVAHADARALRRRPPGRGARRLPPARRAAARARAHARRRRRARSSAGSSSTTRALAAGGRRAASPTPAAPGAGRPRDDQLARLRAALDRRAGRAPRRGDARAASRASARARSSTRSSPRPARRALLGRRPVPGPPRARSSPTCRCSRRSASSRAARRATRSSACWRSARRPGWSSSRGCSSDRAHGARRSASAPRARRARGCCARCSRRSTRSAPPRRVVLVLEDLHWADDSTLDLLAALLRRREPARLLLLGTYRPTGPDGEPPVAALVHDLGVRGLLRGARASRGCPPAAVATYLAGPLPGGAAAGRPRRGARRSARAATRCSCATCSTTGSPTGR